MARWSFLLLFLCLSHLLCRCLSLRGANQVTKVNSENPKIPNMKKINFSVVSKDPAIKALWQKALILKNFTVKAGQFVHSKHFLKEDILYEKILKGPDGTSLLKMVHADLEKDVNSYYVKYQNKLQTYQEQRGIKITRRLTAAKNEEKDTKNCKSKFQAAIKTFYAGSVNDCWNPCITDGLTKKDYQAAIDCCDKKYEAAKPQWNTDLDEVDKCIDEL